MITLAIDTSCDETSVAVVDGVRILSNVVSTQVRYHKKYGGVVPFLAQRLHGERIAAVTELALSRSKLDWSSLDSIAVTQGPGLAPALQVGIAYAKELAITHGKPLYAVNHMAGHIASCLAASGKTVPVVSYPAIAVLVSGGHTEFVYMERFGWFKLIGQTLDDALGEAYDKVAKLLGLGYPGGPIVAKLAEVGMTDRYNLPIPMQASKDLNISYSGLKNAVRLLVEGLRARDELDSTAIANVCASFQYVAQKALLIKLEKALLRYPDVQSVLLGGGVAANTRLRWQIRLLTRQRSLKFFVPPVMKLCADNAAMIGIAANLNAGIGQAPSDIQRMDRIPNLKIDDQLTF